MEKEHYRMSLKPLPKPLLVLAPEAVAAEAAVVVVVVVYQVELFLGSWVPFSFNREAMCPPFGVVNSMCSGVIVAFCVVRAYPPFQPFPPPEWKVFKS